MNVLLNSKLPKPKKAEKPKEDIDQDSHGEARAIRAELSAVHARPNTLLGNAYRGRK